jgi:hypothetical protein
MREAGFDVVLMVYRKDVQIEIECGEGGCVAGAKGSKIEKNR